jgi:leader peptidase (prepilin peptidase)/N-methyltransferase
MIRILGTILAALLGLAFGSFLNVCLSRWPEGESVVKPRSHCRKCARTLAWWENIPLMSWLALRGRCRTCGAWIGWRYPLVEGAIGGLWATVAWQSLSLAFEPGTPANSPLLHYNICNGVGASIGKCLFYWLLVALAALDAENLWLPNWITFPGIGLGFASTVIDRTIENRYSDGPSPSASSLLAQTAIGSLLAILAAAALILLIRWSYWLIRRREGMGLGDAKLMAMLAAWLGLPGVLLSFVIGVMIGAFFALFLLAAPAARRGSETWTASKLPFGTFLCMGGIISQLWGQPIIAAYLRWAGFR